MSDFLKWFANSKVASYLRAFVAVVVSLAVAEFVKSGQIDFTSFESWIVAALGATLPTLLRLLNPQDALS